MQFDKELGKKRLKNFFGGIGKGINNLRNKIKEYQDGEEERTNARIVKLDRQIELQKRTNEMEKLKAELRKERGENTSSSSFGGSSKQESMFTNTDKKQTTKQPSMDDAYSGMFSGG